MKEVETVTKRKNPVLLRWKEAAPDDSYEAWKRSRTAAVKRKNPGSELHDSKSTNDSTTGNTLHNKKLCISEIRYKKLILTCLALVKEYQELQEGGMVDRIDNIFEQVVGIWELPTWACLAHVPI